MNSNLPLHHQCVVDVVETKEMLGYHQFVGRGELFCQVIKEHGELNLDKNKAKFQFFQTTHTLTYLHSNKICREDLQEKERRSQRKRKGGGEEDLGPCRSVCHVLLKFSYHSLSLPLSLFLPPSTSPLHPASPPQFQRSGYPKFHKD